MSIVTRLREGERCPYCGTSFVTDLDPLAVALRKRESGKRSKAAKKGWRKRHAKQKA